MNVVKDRKMELCLCKRCLEGFFRTGNYKIRRSDPIEVIREPCMMCQVGYGYLHVQKSIQQTAVNRYSELLSIE